MSVRDEVNVCASICLITNPSETVFLVQKKVYRPDHVRAFYHGTFGLFGGAWLGDGSQNDLGPRDTVVREVFGEELLLSKEAKRLVQSGLVHEADWMLAVPGYVYSDLGFAPDDVVFLRNAVFTSVVKDELVWGEIETKVSAGTLSAEGQACILSIHDMITSQWSFSHESVVQAYLRKRGVANDRLDSALLTDVTGSYQVAGLSSYEEICRHYKVNRTPFTTQADC